MGGKQNFLRRGGKQRLGDRRTNVCPKRVSVPEDSIAGSSSAIEERKLNIDSSSNRDEEPVLSIS